MGGCGQPLVQRWNRSLLFVLHFHDWLELVRFFQSAALFSSLGLAQAINNSGGIVTKVQRWNNGGWQTYSVGAPFGVFNIESTEGLFLFSGDTNSFEVCQ